LPFTGSPVTGLVGGGLFRGTGGPPRPPWALNVMIGTINAINVLTTISFEFVFTSMLLSAVA
jgi:hypothetical protein